MTTSRINLEKNYTYTHRFYTEEYLRSLITQNRRQAETLVQRYVKWNEKFIAISKSRKYSYDRLEGFRDKLRYLEQDVIEWFAGTYPLYGWKKIQLPGSEERHRLDEEGKRAVIRNQRWNELLIDNRKCMNELIAQGEDPSRFCPNCNHFFTDEEIFLGECACCQTRVENESYWDEDDEY